MKKLGIFTIVFFIIIVFFTGCALFSLPLNNTTVSMKNIAKYCSIDFIDPQTDQPFSSSITLPASIVIKYEYSGSYPVDSLNLNVVQSANDRNWLNASHLDPKCATVNFAASTDAGDFIVSSEMITFDGHSVNATKLLHIIDPSPATITDFEFYLTQNATLVPNSANNAFIWMKLRDDESILFSKSVLASLVNQSRLYINGTDMTTSGFPPESAIISDSGKEMICIALLNIQANHPITGAPVIREGENDVLFVFEGFNTDGSGLIEKHLTLSAAYPDETAPKVQIEFKDPDFHDVGPAPDPLDFAVVDDFIISVQAEDLPDRVGYEPSGLKQLIWTVYEDSGVSESGTIDLSYLDKDAEFTDSIHIKMRDYGWESGIYRIKVSVEDNNGNQTLIGPKTFSYDVTNFKTVDIIDQKLSGDMGAFEYRAGESVRFTIDSGETLQDIVWTTYPAITLVQKDEIKSADYLNAAYGTYEISVQADKNGVPYIGSTQITVRATEGYIYGPEIKVDESSIDLTDPSKPFSVNITTITENPLSEDPQDTIQRRPGFAMIGGEYVPLMPTVDHLNYDRYVQNFNCYLLTAAGSPVVLGSTDYAEWEIIAEDEAGNEKRKMLRWSGSGNAN